MCKVFGSDPQLEHVRGYIVTILIHGYTPSDYDESGSKLTDDQLTAHIFQNRRNEHKDRSLRILQFRK